MKSSSIALIVVFMTLFIALFDPESASAVSSVQTAANIQNAVPTIVNITALPNPVNLQDGCKNGDVNVTCRVVVNDNNGGGDINVNVAPLNATVEFFDNVWSAWTEGAGPYDYNINYNASSPNGLLHNCTWGASWDDNADGVATARNLTCNISLIFFTNASVWRCEARVWDTSDAQTALNSNTTAVGNLTALNILTAQINYGDVAVGANSAQKIATVNNTGNIIIDFMLNGSNMTGAGLIQVGNENYYNYSINDFVNLTDDNPANDRLNINLTKPTTIIGYANNTTWRLFAPLGAAIGAHTGTNWIVATTANAP